MFAATSSQWQQTQEQMSQCVDRPSLVSLERDARSPCRHQADLALVLFSRAALSTFLDPGKAVDLLLLNITAAAAAAALVDPAVRAGGPTSATCRARTLLPATSATAAAKKVRSRHPLLLSLRAS